MRRPLARLAAWIREPEPLPRERVEAKERERAARRAAVPLRYRILRELLAVGLGVTQWAVSGEWLQGVAVYVAADIVSSALLGAVERRRMRAAAHDAGAHNGRHSAT